MQLDYVQHLVVWTLFWLAVFLVWFETAPRILARVPRKWRR